MVLAPAPYLLLASTFTPGNLVVEQCASATSSSTFSILELSPAAVEQTTPVNSIAIAATGATPMRQSASAGTTGRLADSNDGTLVAFSGFEDATGVSDETTITTRAVGTLDPDAKFTLQCAYTGISKDETRTATSLDNHTWYISDKGGVYTNGVKAPLIATNVLSLKSFGGTVYVMSQKFGAVVSTLSADAAALTPLPGLPADGNTTDFYLISSGNNATYDILYYLDETNATSGAIHKYSLVSGTWKGNGTYATSFGGDGLCARTNGSGGAFLYATTGKGGTSANEAVRLTDSAGYNADVAIATGNNITLYSTASGTTLKGIAFAPMLAENSALLTPPAVTPAAGATVDNAFNVTFTNTGSWSLAITNISIGGVSLDAGYAIYSNHITFTPSASVPANLLQTAGSLELEVDATGYNPAGVAQNLGAGAAVELNLTTQPASPSGNGGTLVTQPVVAVQDQYGNTVTTSAATIVAAVGSGNWTLGGITSLPASNGVASFTDLSATVKASAEVDNAMINFSTTGLSPITSGQLYIPAPPTPFTPGNLAVLQADSAGSANSTFTVLELSPASLNSAPVNTIAISATGPDALRNSASASSTGRLADSEDGTLLALTGFASGSSAVTDETTIANRMVATLNANDQVSLACAYTGVSGNQTRGATSLDNHTWYISDKGGVYTNGLSAPANPTNVRSIRSFGGTVFVLSQNAAVISTVSSAGTVLAALRDASGASLPTNGYAVDFYMVSSGNNAIYDILYYLDETNSTAGTIYKYSLQTNGTGWLPNGSWPTPNGGDGFCAVNNGSGGASLFYTTGAGGTAHNRLVQLTDAAGWNTEINITATNTLYTAASSATLKGIAFAPVSAPTAPMVTALGASIITAGSAILTATIHPKGEPTTGTFFCNTNLGSPNNYYDVGMTALTASQSPVSVTNLVAGLLPGENYSFYVNAVNGAGAYDGSGSPETFTTLPVTAPRLGGAKWNNGSFAFTFTNSSGASFSVLATNNLLAPKTAWPVVGQAIESPAGSGNYEYSPAAGTNQMLFYILRQP